MSFCGVFCLYGIGFVATTALCGFRSVGQASCVIIIYVVRKIVSEGFYGFLFYKYSITTRTMFTFGQSACCASRYYGFVRYFCVSKCLYSFLLYKYFVATRTVFAFRQTGCRACCFYCFVGYFCVTECIGFLDFRVSARSTTPS